MLDFKPLELCDIERLRRCFGGSEAAGGRRRLCDYAPGTVMMWRRYFSTEAAWLNDTVVLRAVYYDRKPFYSFPAGRDPEGALRFMAREAAGRRIRFCFTDPRDADKIRAVMHVESAEPDRDMFDYIYNRSELEQLSGRRFHRMKNFANRFEGAYPEYVYHEITADTAALLITAAEKYAAVTGASEIDPMLSAEAEAEREIFENWDIYGFSGGYITVGDEIAAFTVGEVQGDTVHIHVEKADRRFAGAYQVIQRDYLRSLGENGVVYVNREEDLGIPGLRQAKMSYNPVFFGEKCTVICTAALPESETEKTAAAVV